MSPQTNRRCPTGRAHTGRPVLPVLLAAGLLCTLVPRQSAAQDFALHLEPAVSILLDDPQSDRFKTGLYAAIRPSFALGRVASLQWSYAFMYTPPDDGFSDAGSAHFVTAGMRIRPFATLRPETEQLGGLWADFNLGYVRTGELDRLGFDAGLGYGIQVAPSFAVGPALRYVHIVQPNDVAGVDPNDAQFLTAGLNFSFGRPHRPAPVLEAVVCPECIQEECIQNECIQEPCPVAALPVCNDMDGDGVCDDVDRCPTQAGPAETFGCPVDPCAGAPIRVLVQFDFNSTEMPASVSGSEQTMDPVLDAVAAAIAQDPTCRVGILGHTSEEGATDYNQTLSEGRAEAVQRYMMNRGIAADRIPTRGMGEMCPLVPLDSRSMNRRVEFYRLDEGEAPGHECLP